jgi:hypothetical protein
MSTLNYSTILSTTTTTTVSTPLDTSTLVVDYALLFLCSIFYGVAFAPIKHYNTGDGFYFQFVFAIGIWVAGVPMLFFRGFPQFYTLSLVGGVIWAIGNVCTVPVIKLIGIGVGSLFWNMFGLIWAGPMSDSDGNTPNLSPS